MDLWVMWLCSSGEGYGQVTWVVTMRVVAW
jgi:hypothetical protein